MVTNINGPSRAEILTVITGYRYEGSLSHGGTQNHPVVMDDHDLVLKPMVTWGSPMTFEIPKRG